MLFICHCERLFAIVIFSYRGLIFFFPSICHIPFGYCACFVLIIFVFSSISLFSTSPHKIMADDDRFTSSILSFMLSTMPRKGHVRCSHSAFDTLHDSLISFILSKMPVKDAVRSSVLSKRWRFLYTQMPTLTFSIINSSCAISRDENIISNMLLQHSGNLEGFHLDWCYSPENVCKWVEYASQHNVQHLTLFDSPTPPALFSCSSLVKLCLHRHDLTSFPTSFVGFPHLISCYLSCVQMTDESLASLVSFCPLLQKLEMTHCFGVARALISSSAIEHLNIHFQHGVKFVLVDCPKLKLMKAFMIKDLRVNGALFYELSYAVTDLEMYCGDTLTELQLVFIDADIKLRYTEFAARFLEILGNFQSLKKLNIDLERRENIDFPLFKLFQRLPNLQIFSLLGLSLKVCTNFTNSEPVV